MLLFLFSRSSDEVKIAPLIRKSLYTALTSLPAFKDAHIEDKASTALMLYADKVLDDMDQLLLVRELYEQILIYVRYGAKAAGG